MRQQCCLFYTLETLTLHSVTSRVQGAAIDIRGPHKRIVLIRLTAVGPERWLLEGEESWCIVVQCTVEQRLY